MLADIPCSSIPQSMVEKPIADYGIIGIGNDLMGDDGAGIVAVEKLQSISFPDILCFFYALRHDLFEITELLNRAKRFLFIDAYLGKPAGVVKVFSGSAPAPVPSLHQSDIGTVMKMLEPLHLCDPFPSWEIWGISVEPPFQLGAELSRPVVCGVEQIVNEIKEFVRNG